MENSPHPPKNRKSIEHLQIFTIKSGHLLPFLGSEIQYTQPRPVKSKIYPQYILYQIFSFIIVDDRIFFSLPTKNRNSIPNVKLICFLNIKWTQAVSLSLRGSAASIYEHARLARVFNVAFDLLQKI